MTNADSARDGYEVRRMIRIAIIKRAQRYESMCRDDLREDNINGAAKLSNIAHGLRLAADIVEEWKPMAEEIK